MSPAVRGVVVADVVRSSASANLPAILRQKLRIATIAHLEERRITLPYAITAGDEFQTLSESIRGIPALIFDIRRRLQPLQLRIGVGIGRLAGRIRPPVNTLAGEPFQMARRAIEHIKTRRLHRCATLTAFRSTNERFDDFANLVYELHDALLQSISARQWDTISMYVPRNRVDLAAKALKIDVSTASRNLDRGHYWQIEETIEVMTRIIDYSFA